MALLGLDTSLKKGIFLLYMGLWCALRMFIYGSQQGEKREYYDQTTLLIFVCILKLVIACGMYLQQDGGFTMMAAQWKENQSVFFKYLLPAASYVVYDNLTFVNLSMSDPVTYVILMQMRLAATGLTWQAIFGKNLNKNQWIAILLLTGACVCQKGGKLLMGGTEEGRNTSVVALLLIGLQIACGVFSSVFNEFLLKEKGSAGVNLQNMFMYTHSIICNVVWLIVCPTGACKRDLWSAMQPEELYKMVSPLVVPILLIMASIGIVTSLFIKHLDSIRKTIASAMEIFVDAILALLFFGIRIGPETVLATCMAAGGVLLYSRPQEVKKQDEEERRPSSVKTEDLENPENTSFQSDVERRNKVTV